MIRVCHTVIDAEFPVSDASRTTISKANTFIQLVDEPFYDVTVEASSEYDEDKYAQLKFVGRRKQAQSTVKGEFYEPSRYHRSARHDCWKKGRKVQYRISLEEKSFVTGRTPVMMDGYWEDGRFYPYFE